MFRLTGNTSSSIPKENMSTIVCPSIIRIPRGTDIILRCMCPQHDEKNKKLRRKNRKTSVIIGKQAFSSMNQNLQPGR